MIFWMLACNSEPLEGQDTPTQPLLMLEELGPPVLTTFDPLSASTSTRFTVPSGGFAYELDMRDDTLFLSYTAPATDGGSGYDRSRIVSIDAANQIEPLACRDAPGVWCFFPVAAPDSTRVWFVMAGEDVVGDAENLLAYVENGQTTQVMAWATEPAISADGSLLAWVQVDPETRRRRLELADRDGHYLQTLVASGVLTDISYPFFAGDFVYFVVPTPTTASLWDWLIPSAQAHGTHDIPGDWWRVPILGGDAEQISYLNTIHYDGQAYPDGKWFVTTTREGLVLIDLETGEATSLLETRTVRALAWVE